MKMTFGDRADNQLLIKKLLYRSLHRGCKETDILLGQFATAQINNLNHRQIETYKDFIEEDDLAIYNWILNKEEAPDRYISITNEIKKFHNLD